MTKSEIIAQLAQRMGTSKAEAKRLLEAQIEAISHHLAIGDSVVLRGLGTFSTREVAARRGHRPTDGEALEIPARRQVTFRASEGLRDAVQVAEPPA
ncbi:MAG: HU family DNA-binding protein [Halofilum sp. (in: g-proteobacteria)]|nr:HU family DNA-binding protein [Halofilum sp. (in: g-proteobacteria)]